MSAELLLGRQHQQERGGEGKLFYSSAVKEGCLGSFALEGFLLEILILSDLIFRQSCWTAGGKAR